MCDEFKKEMTKAFETIHIGLISYYLDIEVKQEDGDILITQEGYTNEVLKRFKMEDSKPVSTPIQCGIKLSKHEEGDNVDPTLYKSLIGSIRYLTCTRLKFSLFDWNCFSMRLELSLGTSFTPYSIKYFMKCSFIIQICVLHQLIIYLSLHQII